MIFAFFAHMVGILLTIYSGGYTGLLISTLFIAPRTEPLVSIPAALIETIYDTKYLPVTVHVKVPVITLYNQPFSSGVELKITF